MQSTRNWGLWGWGALPPPRLPALAPGFPSTPPAGPPQTSGNSSALCTRSPSLVPSPLTVPILLWLLHRPAVACSPLNITLCAPTAGGVPHSGGSSQSHRPLLTVQPQEGCPTSLSLNLKAETYHREPPRRPEQPSTLLRRLPPPPYINRKPVPGCFSRPSMSPACLAPPKPSQAAPVSGPKSFCGQPSAASGFLVTSGLSQPQGRERAAVLAVLYSDFSLCC